MTNTQKTFMTKGHKHSQHSTILRYRAKKMGYHCIPTLLTLNLIL